MLAPDTLIFAVRSLMRLGTAARAAYEQSARDAPIRLDHLPRPIVEDDAALWAFFYALPRRARVQPNGDLAHLWRDGKPADEESRSLLQSERVRLLSEEAPPAGLSWTEARLAREAPALAVLEQWAPGQEPPDPWTRIALALADVALEFSAAYPGVVGVGGNGEKLLAALGSSLRELLPDADDKNDWSARPAHYQFAERTLVILFRAGLHVVSEKADLLVPEEQYRELLLNLAKPLLDVFERNPLDRPRLSEMRDLLLGPMARAALTTLQKHPRAFFGRRFDPNEAVAAITTAVIEAAAADGLADVFTPDGLLKVYRAALDVAVSRPGLFVEGDGPQAQAVRAVLVSIAGTLRQAPPPFGGALGADVAVAAIEALKGNVPGLLRLGDRWKGAAAELIDDVLGGLAEGLRSHPDASIFETLFTTEEALELVNTFMREIAHTPGMLGSAGARAEVRLLLAAFASALAARGTELLRASDWIAIAQAVAVEAARNPLKLVAVAGADGAAVIGEQLLARVLVRVLKSAAEAFPAEGRAAAALLFGELLRECVVRSVQAAAGNAGRAKANVAALGALIQRLQMLAVRYGDRIGSREWLWLFSRHVAEVLDRGVTDVLTIELLLGELETRT